MSYDVTLARRPAIWRDKWHQTPWGNAGLPVLEDPSQADNNASLVPDPLGQPGSDFPEDVKQSDIGNITESEPDVEFPPEKLLSERRILGSRDHLDSDAAVGQCLI